MEDKAILLLSCPDRKGIVAKLSEFIYINNGNIISSNQHTEHTSNTFFMRIEWELSDFAIPKEEIAEKFRVIAEEFDMDWELHFGNEILNMAVFVSQYEHCLYDLLIRQKSGELRVNIPLIISNHSSLKSIADYFEIPFYFFPIEKETQLQTESKELELLKRHNIDFIVLARYMRILTANFISHYKNKIINIHHSFLPAFVGAKPYHQAYKRGVKLIGATSHYVTEELDNGPIIEQDIIRVSHKDGIRELIAKGKDIEKLVLYRAVKKHSEYKILVFDNKTIVFD